MKRKISCFCDFTFEAEIPEEINLDTNPEFITEILDGIIFTYTCSRCSKKHKPEFPLMVLWPAKKLRLEVFPELERGTFYRRDKAPVFKDKNVLETVIGYPEMAERIAIINDGYDPMVIEAIKYYLYLKAEENNPDSEVNIWYIKPDSPDEKNRNSLEFHIHGIRQDEVAKMNIPLSLYNETRDDYKKHPREEIYRTLRVQSYLSVKNTMRTDPLSSEKD